MIKTRTLTLMAMLTCLSFSSRVIMVYLPNIQMTTIIVVLCSFVLTPIEAVIVATGSAILSNIVLGLGLYTYWQIFTWGLIAVISSIVIGKHHTKLSLNLLSLYAGLSGIAYGMVISIFGAKFMAMPFWIYYIYGLPMDLSHAIGNTIFMYLFYPIFIKIYNNFEKKGNYHVK